jgi:hypothetical protein
MAKTVKPRTNLLLDMRLFSLAIVHLTAAMAVNIILPNSDADSRQTYIYTFPIGSMRHEISPTGRPLPQDESHLHRYALV